MTKILIANADNTTLTDTDKIIQFKIESKLSSCTEEQCVITTNIFGLLSETWKEKLLTETLVLSTDIATAFDEVFDFKTSNRDEGYEFIRRSILHTYIERVESLNFQINELKKAPQFHSPSNQSLIAREHLSTLHILQAQHGNQYILDAKWD